MLDDQSPAGLVLRDPLDDALQWGVGVHDREVRGHHRLDRRVPKGMRRGAIQIDQGHAPDKTLLVGDGDAAQSVAAAADGGVVDGRRHIDHGKPARVDVPGATYRRDGRGHDRHDGCPRLIQRQILDHGGGRRPMPAAAHRGQHLRDIEATAAAASRHEDAMLHLDQQEAGVTTGEVHHPVSDHTHALHVDTLTQGRDEYGGLLHREFLGALEGGGQRVALGRGEGIGEPLLERGRVRAAEHAERQSLSVPWRRGGERQRTGVLVDAEGEHRRLEGRDRDAALGDDVDEQRDQGPVSGAHERLGRETRRQIRDRRVVIEGHDLHPGRGAQSGQVAQTVRVHGVDEDESAHAFVLHVDRVDHGHEVAVKRLELAHIAVHGAAQTDVRLGVQLVHRDHGGEGVEVGVGVRGDQLGRAHHRQYTGATPSRPVTP